MNDLIDNSSVMMTKLKIREVRHLKGISLSLCDADETQRKHLLITGKNGSGKTSLLDAMAKCINDVGNGDQYANFIKAIANTEKARSSSLQRGDTNQAEKFEMDVEKYKRQLKSLDSGVDIIFDISDQKLGDLISKGRFITAYFKADRALQAEESEHVEKVQLKDSYGIFEDPSKEIVKYLVDKKVSQSLYETSKKDEKSKALIIQNWFDSFETLLKRIFNDDTLELSFDVETFSFSINEKGRLPFGFNTMSDGYAAILNIVVSIIMRMEKNTNGIFDFNMPGVVLIDELETHLHYELQKNALPLLTGIFPNIQFVVTTHSAFVLNSIENAVIYDLENHTLVKEGLSDIPYDGLLRDILMSQKCRWN